MNEQELADLFSEQIDRLLQDQAVTLPEEAADLPGLLALGQQFNQVSFKPGAAAQAAFQSQLAAWGGQAGLGLSKTVLLGLGAVLVGLGLGLAILVGLWSGERVEPEGTATVLPAAPVSNPTLAAEPETTRPAPLATATRPAQASDQVPATTEVRPAVTASLGDRVILPTSTPSPVPPTATPVPAINPAGGSDESGGNGGGDKLDGDHDRGHGNDPDGIDEDNPGQGLGGPGGDSGGSPGSSGDHKDNDKGGKGGHKGGKK